MLLDEQRPDPLPGTLDGVDLMQDVHDFRIRLDHPQQPLGVPLDAFNPVPYIQVRRSFHPGLPLIPKSGLTPPPGGFTFIIIGP